MKMTPDKSALIGTALHRNTTVKASAARIEHRLSFDIEDWHDVPFVTPYLARVPAASKQISVVEAGTRRILELLRDHQTHATFFIVGQVAERFPKLVRDIAAEGHELASHGYSHVPIDGLTPTEFENDIQRSIATLERIAGVRPIGYRAPLASVGRENLWILDVLRENGFLYDSSIYPANPVVYAGLKDLPSHAHEIVSGFYEIPLTVERFYGLPIPVSGGFYLRALPFSLYCALLRRKESNGESVVLYQHSWEFETSYPRPITNPMKRFVQYHNLHQVETRMRKLLDLFQFSPLRDAIPNVGLAS